MNGELNGTRARSYRTRASEIDRPFEGASVKTIPAALASAPLCGAGEGRRGAGHATAPWTAAPVSEPGGKELAAREMRPAVGKKNTQGLLPAISSFADRSPSAGLIAHELYPLTAGHLRIIDTKFYIHASELYQSILEIPSKISIGENTFRELQQNLRGEWASGAPCSKAMATLLFEQCLYLCLRHGTTFSDAAPFYHALEQRAAQLTGLERKISEYVAEHYWESITLDQLSSELRYSKNYLCKVFKATTGATISEYANFLRVRKAYDLVCYTDQKLSEIAVSCGFSSIHYFSRVFHKYVGMAPSQMRDRDRSTLDTDIRLHGTFHYRYYSPAE